VDRYLSISLPIRIGILCAIGFALLLVASPVKAGEMTATYGPNHVTLSERSCSHAATLARIQPEAAREHYRMARGFIGGQDFFGCWRAVNTTVFVIWEDGEYTPLPMADFGTGKPGV
jgi:hypothetical protein